MTASSSLRAETQLLQPPLSATTTTATASTSASANRKPYHSGRIRTTRMEELRKQQGGRRRRHRRNGLSLLLVLLLFTAGTTSTVTAAFTSTISRTRSPSPLSTSSRNRQISPTSRLNMLPPIDPATTLSSFHTIAEQWHHHYLTTTAVTSSSHLVTALTVNVPTLPDVPFEKMSNSLMDSLDIGKAIGRSAGATATIPESTISLVLDTLGRDILLFLSASVVVTLLSKMVHMTPILGYLLAGALLGPHGLDIFANTAGDVELGDFGILFLLFSEGLEVSTSRLNQLTRYLPLGFAQIALCTGVITAAIMGGGPEFLQHHVPNLIMGADDDVLQNINPVEAVIVAIAGTLSTSAFVFPVLKERGWEEEPSGEAATSVLLLQDLMVAPLLVLLPYLVGQDATDYSAIGFLTAKAVFGFGGILYVGRSIIAKLFDWVSKAQSAETFVALTLLVSAGMGTIAKSLGLTDTAGAFAAGVLLANTGYRAQIQADILPFKGILLGIFFMDAGSNFDIELAIAAWPTILAGVVSLITLKAATMLLATRVPEWMEPNRLPKAEGVKLAVLLAGGGEFAFVVLALAERLGVVSEQLSGLLTAIILITMGLTPLLGELASIVSEKFVEENDNEECRILFGDSEGIADNPIVVCGYGDAGHAVLHSLAEAKETLLLESQPEYADENGSEKSCGRPSLVVFDTDPFQLERSMLVEDNAAVVLFGDGSNPAVIRSSGIENPQSFFVCYEEHNEVLAATSRLSSAFPNVPIFARAQTRKEAESLKMAGATEAVVESDELARSAPGLMRTSYITNTPAFGKSLGLKQQMRRLAAAEAGISIDEVDYLLDIFQGLDQDGNGVEVEEVMGFLRKSNTGLTRDDEIEEMEAWFEASGITGTISSLEFFQLYGRAPDYIEAAFGCQNNNQVVDSRVLEQSEIETAE